MAEIFLAQSSTYLECRVFVDTTYFKLRIVKKNERETSDQKKIAGIRNNATIV